MAKNKTTETSKSVDSFIEAIGDETKRDDSYRIIQLMKKQTGFEPKLWGPSIIGFGSCHYKYESGHEGDMPLAAFSPRSTAIVLYLSVNFDKREDYLKILGKHKTGKSCIYIKKLDDVKFDVLNKMISASTKYVKKLYPDKKQQ